MNWYDTIGKMVAGKKIIVYGAGDFAKRVVKWILLDNLQMNLHCIAVSDCKGNPYEIMGKPVVCIDDLKEEASCYMVLVATQKKWRQEIQKKLEESGFKYVYILDEILFRHWEKNAGNDITVDRKKQILYCRRYREPYIKTLIGLCQEKTFSEKAIRSRLLQETSCLERKSLCISRLVVVLGTKCSLRCKECNNLIPHFSPQKDLDTQKILKSLHNILQQAEAILKIELIGGEPFLANNLKDVLNFLMRQEKVHQIEITTNGGVVPKEELEKLMQCQKVKVRISDYGSLVPNDKLIAFLKEKEIAFEILHFKDWISPGGVEKRHRTIEELEKLYSRCSSGWYCKTLYENKIFACARAASLYALGYMKEPEFIDVSENADPNELKEFWTKSYSISCDYCNLTCDERIFVKPAEQGR